MQQKKQKNIYYAANAKSKPLLTRFITKFVGLIARVLYRPKYHNQKYIPLEQSYMLLGNHHSLLDPVLIHLGIPDYVHWVAKEELFKIPVLSRILEKLEIIPLHRGRVDLSAMRRIIKCLQEEKIIGIFPQGGRVDWENYQSIMPQAGVASIVNRYQAVIVPFYCQTPYKIFRKNHVYFGAPYCLNPSLNFKDKKAMNQEMAIELLRQSYSIADVSYQIQDNSRVLELNNS
ncbi:MAG: 1-acyl-sn-glycerol-3-phosphate acyltransferase [Clostridiaceae bacterium]|jgi:1-acyl-sn-glycerol-3-phosphate acyltransferase|nr:lysophospholipid acyltransferase family protein [Bacillota bacterium]NLN51217.1 1-acyl-sn-glycerol-3-phosphate acyltransferase [Clostridiaceae bacterium]